MELYAYMSILRERVATYETPPNLERKEYYPQK